MTTNRAQRRSLSCFARSYSRQFRVEQAVDPASTWRGVAQPANSSMLALEMNSLRPLVEPSSVSSCSSPAFLHTLTSAVNAMSYLPDPPVIAVFDIPATLLGEPGQRAVRHGAVRPAGRSEDGKYRLDRVRPPGFLSTRLRVCSASFAWSVCPADPAIPGHGSGNASRTWLLGQDAGLLHSSANCMDGSCCSARAGSGRTPEDGSARCLPRRVEDPTSSARSPRSAPLPAFARSRNNDLRPRA